MNLKICDNGHEFLKRQNVQHARSVKEKTGLKMVF